MNELKLQPPAGWVGTIPEWYAHWALTKLGIDFIYQYPQAGGRQARGGIVADFYIPETQIAINIQSTYWHSGVEKEATDKMQMILLESMGIQVVLIDENDILRNPLYYIQEALKGRSHAVR